jgi:hypothetical protein
MSRFQRQVQRQRQVQHQEPQLAPSQQTIVGYFHGSNVMLIGGVHKGIQGEVTEFFPAKYSFDSLKSDTVYVPQTHVLSTNEQIIGEVPVLYHIELDNGNFINLPAEMITEVIIYKSKKQKTELGHLVSTTKNSFTVQKINLTNLNEMLANLQVEDKLSLDSNSSLLDEMLQVMSKKEIYKTIKEKLSKKLKDGEDIAEIFNNETIEISPEAILSRVFFVYKGEHIGKYGKLSSVLEPMYLIERKSAVILTQSAVQKVGENLKIIKGKYKSDRLYNNSEYVYLPPHLNITLNSNGRKITASTYNVGTSDEPKFVTRPITPNDVFYYDIKMVDDENEIVDAEVLRVNKNNTFDARKRTIEGFADIPNVQFKDVVNLEPGFRWKYPKQTQIETESPVETEFVQEEETNNIEETDDVEDPESNDYGEEEAEEVLEAEPEMKETFNDRERLNIEEIQLTGDQKTYKNKVVHLLEKSNINEDSINVYQAAEHLDALMKELNSKNEDIVTDKNYIIAALVFCELIRANYRQVKRTFGFNSYVEGLISSTFLSQANVLENIGVSALLNENFLVSSGTLTKEEYEQQHADIQNLYYQENVKGIMKVLMKNALSLIKSKFHFHILEEPNTISLESLIPIGRHNPNGAKTLTHEYSFQGKNGKTITIKKYASEYPEDTTTPRMITVDDLVQNNIPEEETRILWGKDAQVFVKQTKEEMQILTMNENDSEIIKGYEYVIKNIERGPYAIRELPDSEFKNYFTHVFKSLVKAVMQQKNRTKSKIEKRKRIAEDERNEMNERRRKIRENLYMDVDVDEEDEVEPIEDTNSYKKEKRMREIKSLIAKGNRQRKFAKENKESDEENEENEDIEEEENEEEKAWKEAMKKPSKD